MATFNVFGSTTQNDIRVGYISTDRGLVEGVTICDANSYAKLNPGTQFIFRNREEIQYLNINEVNALTPDSLGLEIPKKSCQGYEQDPTPVLGPSTCNAPAKAYFYGGGGIGVKGTPIIGQDGGLMAVVLTSGGFGYQYPPITEVKDECRIAGAPVVRSVLGEQVSTVETYDNEQDFEEYDLDHGTCPEPIPSATNRNAAGKDVGKFDPRVYTNPEESDDPIRKQILEYQEKLRAVEKPFWSTRKTPPLRVIGGGRNDREFHKVKHYAWGGSRSTAGTKASGAPALSKEFVDIKMNVFTAGGHGRGMLFNFSSEDGTHKFTIKADNFKEKRTTSITQKVKRNTLYKVVAQGSYKGAGVEQGLVNKLGKKPKELNPQRKERRTGDTIFCDFAKSANDNDDLQIQATQGKFIASNRDRIKGHSTFELEYILGDNSAFISKKSEKIVEVIEDSFMNRYAISPVPPSNVPGSDFAGVQYTFEWKENFPFSGEYIFRSMGDNICKVFLDNREVISTSRFVGRPDKVKKVVSGGEHKIRIDLYNTPRKVTTREQPSGKVPVKFDVYGQGKRAHRVITYTFTSEDGKDSFTFKPGDTSNRRYSYSRTVNVLPNVDYKVKAVTSGKTSSEKEFNIQIAAPGTKGRGDRAAITGRTVGTFARKDDNYGPGSSRSRSSSRRRELTGISDKEIEFTDSTFQNDRDAWFSIESVDPGVTAKFTGTSEDNLKLIVKGEGDVTLRLKWDESPSSNDQAVGEIKVAGKTFRQTNDRKAEVIHTIKTSGGQPLKVEQGTLKRGSFKKGGKGIESSGPSNLIFADITTSANDNDDMQIRCGSGEFTPSNRRKADENRGSTYDLKFRVEQNVPTGEIQEKTVFSTIDFINKADRPLWRINPEAGKDSDFLNRFGILPFDLAAPDSLSDDYAGTHPIRWNDLNFPVDGNYDIEVQVDDNVTLRFIDRNGNETIIEKEGYTAPLNRGGKSTGKSVVTKFFKKGGYRLVADLFQRRGKELAKGNPMVLAIQIKTSFIKTTEDLKQSWQENPMGAALTIVAPPVPRPELPIPKAPGRCPNNPFWTTRFPGASNYWYPVIVPKRWGKFMNRHAISPLPPLAVRSTDGGGVTYQTSWDIDAPYDGFYGLRATADNGGRILIDGVEVMSGGRGFEAGGGAGLSREFRNVKGGVGHFKQNPRNPLKVFIKQGKHKITVEVRNEDTEEKQAYKEKVFNTADWVVPGVITENSFDVVYIGLHPRNRKLKVSSDRKRIDFSDGDGKYNDGDLQITSGNATFSKDGNKITGTGVIRAKLSWYDDPNKNGACIRGVIINGVELTRDSDTETREKRIPIDIAAPGTKGRGSRAAILGYIPPRGRYDYGPSKPRVLTGVSDDEIKYTDSTFQNDEDASFKILSPSPGVKAKFSPDGKELIVRGNGDVTLRLKWRDDPGSNDQAVGELKIAGKTFRQRGKSGEQIETIKVSGKTIDKLSKTGSDSNNINLSTKGPAELVGLTGGTAKDGVTYEGPTIASYRKGSLGPFLTPAYTSDEQYLAEFQGTTWNMFWKGVNFPQQGRYTIQIQADDIAKLRIDGQEVASDQLQLNRGVSSYEINQTAGRKTVEIELFNQGERTGPFSINPTVVAAKIEYNGTRGTGKSKSWDDNPMGISAELIPPPCPKEVGGKGVVTEVIVDDPGNGFPPPELKRPDPDDTPPGTPPTTVPVGLRLKRVDIVQPGINLRCGEDQIVSDPPIPGLSYECGTFGTPTKVIVPDDTFLVQRPEIRIITETGIPPTFSPQFEVVIDPIGVPEELLIQVTDLPGIKRTGFVDGRSYFGAVYYADGLKFAGFFATVGEPVRVYDTLQESIDAQVTTPPSAIQRQGTDITANDPRLNIPDTPDEIV